MYKEQLVGLVTAAHGQTISSVRVWRAVGRWDVWHQLTCPCARVCQPITQDRSILAPAAAPSATREDLPLPPGQSLPDVSVHPCISTCHHLNTMHAPHALLATVETTHMDLCDCLGAQAEETLSLWRDVQGDFNGGGGSGATPRYCVKCVPSHPMEWVQCLSMHCGVCSCDVARESSDSNSTASTATDQVRTPLVHMIHTYPLHRTALHRTARAHSHTVPHDPNYASAMLQ